MRRKIYLFLILFILLTIPISVLADTCTTPIISGGGSSKAGSSGTLGSCSSDSGSCLSICSKCTSTRYIGVRIQIYKYTGTGSYKDIKLIGKGVDIWAFSDLKNSNYRFSSPSNNNLKTKSSCSQAKLKSNISYGTCLTNIYKYGYKSYLSGDNGTVTYDTNLVQRYIKGTIDDYLLTDNYSSGWIKSNILQKLIDNTEKSRNELATLFNLTSSQIDDIQKNSSDYYIYAEMLYRFSIKSGRYTTGECSKSKYYHGGNSDYYYLGTASEAAQFHGNSDIYLALYQDINAGKLISGGLINKVYGKISSNQPYNDYSAENGQMNSYVACNSGYGVNIWNLDDVCEECGQLTCESYCSSYSSGSVEHNACATSWCELNDSGNASCVSSCSPKASDTGCDDKYKNKCDTYQTNGVTTKKVSSNTCSDSGKTPDETLSTKVCYDDGSTYTSTNVKYYKIECTENLVLSNLPQKTTAYLNDSNIASLYTGYKMQYSKSCQLYYKQKGTTNSWTKKYSESKLKADIQSYEDIISGKKYTSSMTEDEKKAFKKAAETAKKEIENVKTVAQNKLKEVSAIDYKSGTNFTNTVTLQVASSSKTSTSQTVTLVPVYCTTSNTTNEKKCTLENNTSYKITDYGIAVCTDSSGKDKTSSVTITDENSYSSYTKTVYYGLPSSYVAVTNGDIYTGSNAQSRCSNAVNAAHGYCKEFENIWLFDPVSENVSLQDYNSTIGSNALKISVSGYGSCGQFSYNLSCDYDYSEKDRCTYCEKKGYTYGTEEYKKCFNRYCGCDAYCGSNVACRAKYCPNECDGCDYDEKYDCDTCLQKCDAYTGEDKITCITNCGYDECTPGDYACTENVCEEDCQSRLDEGFINAIEYSTCINKCDCINGNCGGDYYYRTIDLDRPFPGGTGLTREPGANWYQKVEYITNNDSNSKYYDSTNGRTSDYEYRITLSSDDIKLIKNNLNTTYTEYKKSTSVKKNSGMYCSYLLHDYLPSKNINLEIGSTVSMKTGCV